MGGDCFISLKMADHFQGREGAVSISSRLPGVQTASRSGLEIMNRDNLKTHHRIRANAIFRSSFVPCQLVSSWFVRSSPGVAELWG